NIKSVIGTLILGISFDERIVKREGLYILAEQVERLKAVWQAAEQHEMALKSNSRTNIYNTGRRASRGAAH
ncbi:MAG: hypothetical protein P8M25_03135, partial [Paracoccaceae bacterium]|nr:hypothetical protein [Paracoccaceae bacterium]